MFRTIFILLGACVVVGGCTIQQTVDPAQVSSGSEICIIENPDVREGFLAEFESTLVDNGIQHKVLPKGSGYSACEWIATYNARWSWDLALYMSYAEINIYRNGVSEGKALYDSTGGGASMSKFIDAETKIRELVNQLLLNESAFIFYNRFGSTG